MKNYYTPYYNIPTCYTSTFDTITPETRPQALTLESTEYLNGYLRTQIGKKVSVAFLIGTESYIDKSGTLLAVGANFILIKQAGSNEIVSCDFYAIKFITIYK